MADPVSFAPASGPARVAKIDSAKPARMVTARDASPVGKALPALVALAAELAREVPVDHAKVAQIRAAIADGSYRIDPDRIAAGLIAFGRGSRG
jgi:negative regulator of flagellin synthesis FlgM